MPTLVLLRHAKSDWPANTGDLERRLTARGRRDAAVAGRVLAQMPLGIEVAKVSPAARTRQTWEIAAGALGGPVAAEVADEVYEASPGALLEVVRGLVGETAVIVGHSPGIPRLAALLTANQDSEAFARLRLKYPTCGLTVLQSVSTWSDWGPGVAELVDFIVPRAEPLAADND